MPTGPGSFWIEGNEEADGVDDQRFARLVSFPLEIETLNVDGGKEVIHVGVTCYAVDAFSSPILSHPLPPLRLYFSSPYVGLVLGDDGDFDSTSILHCCCCGGGGCALRHDDAGRLDTLTRMSVGMTCAD